MRSFPIFLTAFSSARNNRLTVLLAKLIPASINAIALRFPLPGKVITFTCPSDKLMSENEHVFDQKW